MTSFSKREREFQEGIDEVDVVNSLLEQNSEILDIFRRTKIKREGRTPYIDYEATPWGILLQNPDIGDPLTQVGKRFRRRFRIPHPLFRQIVEECESINLFETEVPKLVRIPLKFKELMCLRVLGRGNCHDDIAEPTQSFNSSILECKGRHSNLCWQR